MSRVGPISVFVLVLVCGCDAAPTKPLSKSEVFVKAQQGTITPHGKIDTTSVQEAPDGKMTYETSDGSKWKVSMETAADGQPRFGQPMRQAD